jgi:cephalosporin hydroxylase
MEYTYTSDWFSRAIPTWLNLKNKLYSRKSFLEIGVYEGRSVMWTAENMLEDGGEIHCVDNWAADWCIPAERVFRENVKIFNSKNLDRKVIIHKDSGYKALLKFSIDNTYFDFIYIDSSHSTQSVILEAVLSFQLLKPTGIMVFDDYTKDQIHYENGLISYWDIPKSAVDSFVALHKDELIVLERGKQFIIQKIPNRNKKVMKRTHRMKYGHPHAVPIESTDAKT